MTPEELDRLFAETLQVEYDDDQHWSAIRALYRRGDREIFDRACAWCASPDPLERARGADILCQLRSSDAQSGDILFAAESESIVVRAMQAETDEAALSSQIYALGHLRQPDSIPVLIGYAGSPNEDIRWAVAWSLSSFHGDPLAHATLMRLAADPDGDVRDYALFVLGSLDELDTPALRDLFASHLDDPNPEAREEAIAALAKRQDRRAVLPLLRLMESGSYYMHHEDCYEKLVGEVRRGDETWGTEDFIDLLYERFSDLLPPREQNT
jgi:HEAT repeat protein